MISNSEDFIDMESSKKPRKRLFEAGHMKLLVLHLIAQTPQFSYDIIKEIGNIVGGGYSPSTGTIYPTLNYLEEQQFIQSDITLDDRKQYRITDAGMVHLQKQIETVEKIMNRFDTRKQIQNNQQYLEIKRAMEHLKASLRLKIQHCELSVEQVQDIADKIDQAAVEISRL